MKALILRLDAPMLSFGGVTVDHHGFIDRFPGTSMICGLVANALGWDHRDTTALNHLQDRIVYAARWDVAPVEMVDYHTVDLGQSGLREFGWTTQGSPEHRLGGPARFGTHQRYRHYWTDGIVTVALTLVGDNEPKLLTVLTAFRRPARPLFLGRKTCLPARPLLDPETPIQDGMNVVDILDSVPLWDRYANVSVTGGPVEACWPADLGGTRSILERKHDLRDWDNSIPAGSTWRNEGLLGGDKT